MIGMKKEEKNIKRKKLLVLGGGVLHKKIVEEANKLGIKTYVVDNQDVLHSPSKIIAYKYYNINIYDVDSLLSLCEKENIDGIISLFFNVTMPSYYQICEKMKYYSLGNKNQYDNFNNKIKFKRICEKCGIESPKIYLLKDINKNFKDFPIIVKPNDSSGSKGQTTCYSLNDFKNAVVFAKKNSLQKKIIIEKYINSYKEITIECLVNDEKVYILNILDFYCGDKDKGIDRVYELIISSKAIREKYIKKIEKDVERLVCYNKVKNGFCVFQGRFNKNKLFFFDASIRLGGSFLTSEFISKGINLSKIAINFALNGKLDFDFNSVENYLKNQNKIYICKYIVLDEGIIKKIEGIENICKHKNFVCLEQRLYVGDKVKKTNDVRQILCGIVMAFDTKEKLVKFFEKDNFNIRVYDENNKNMVIDDFERCKSIIFNV